MLRFGVRRPDCPTGEADLDPLDADIDADATESARIREHHPEVVHGLKGRVAGVRRKDREGAVDGGRDR